MTLHEQVLQLEADLADSRRERDGLVRERDEAVAACEAATQIEGIRDGMSECYARLNDYGRGVSAESKISTRKTLESLKVDLRRIRQQLYDVIAKAKGATA